ncbi:MAG TPA: Ig-like domain-containing protein [Gemmatimonadales bacterium]|jgi:Bacterial Ig-like domain (group 2).
MTGATNGFGLGLLLAAAALVSACGGSGSGDTTGPPPGGADQVDSLVLSLDSVDVPVDDTVRIHAEARDANGEVVPGVQLTFTSSNPAVATVSDDGLVTAVDMGKAEIEVGIAGTESLGMYSRAGPALSEALAGGSIRPKMIVIVQPKVVITPGEQALDAGATSQYSVILTRGKGVPLQGSTTITWSSSNTSVATVDQNTGLATAVDEGDTRITAKIVVGSAKYGGSVLLHVGLCGGIFKVVGWAAFADMQYKASGTDTRAKATYKVDQITTGQASLALSYSSPDSVVWEGVVTGQVKLDNSVSFPVAGKTAVTKESKEGGIEAGYSALAVLKVKKPAEGSYACTYSFKFGDFFRWEVTNNQGAPAIPKEGPVGIALHTGVAVGARPADGRWVLGGTGKAVKLPGATIVGNDGVYRSAYMPGTQLGILIIGVMGKTIDPRYGTATFVYDLTATQ